MWVTHSSTVLELNQNLIPKPDCSCNSMGICLHSSYNEVCNYCVNNIISIV
uniref:Uncharacterized protein n=1 Tax=Anguilla anguilla TaxID=7936 RepID=A0A0E9WM85_ANGAN